MGSNILEQQIGELTGQLKSLIPALEKVEDRLRVSEERSAISASQYNAMLKEHEELKRKFSDRMEDIYTYMDCARLENLTRKSEIVSVGKDLHVEIEKQATILKGDVRDLNIEWTEEKGRRAGMSGKMWEVFKLVMAASAGALASLITK